MLLKHSLNRFTEPVQPTLSASRCQGKAARDLRGGRPAPPSHSEPARYRCRVATRKRVTIKDVAAATGLSPAAVSYAMRGVQTTLWDAA